MASLSARGVLRSHAALIVFVLAAACSSPAEPPAPVALTLATGGAGGSSLPLGEALAERYRRAYPGAVVEIAPGNSGQNVAALEEGQAHLGFAQADVAFAAFRKGGRGAERSRLRGVGVLWTNVLQIIVPASSDITRMEDLRGRRVQRVAPGSATFSLARAVFRAYELDGKVIDVDLAPGSWAEALTSNHADVLLTAAGLPTESVSQVTHDIAVRLVPVRHDHMRAMRAQFPFMQPLTIPAGLYPGVDEDVETVGAADLLLCREDVPEQFVYELTKLLFESLPELRRTLPVAALIDVEQAAASPIPLHPGAARYFREREIAQ